jgi:hypothetical protein
MTKKFRKLFSLSLKMFYMRQEIIIFYLACRKTLFRVYSVHWNQCIFLSNSRSTPLRAYLYARGGHGGVQKFCTPPCILRIHMSKDRVPALISNLTISGWQVAKVDSLSNGLIEIGTPSPAIVTPPGTKEEGNTLATHARQRVRGRGFPIQTTGEKAQYKRHELKAETINSL